MLISNTCDVTWISYLWQSVTGVHHSWHTYVHCSYLNNTSFVPAGFRDRNTEFLLLLMDVYKLSMEVRQMSRTCKWLFMFKDAWCDYKVEFGILFEENLFQRSMFQLPAKLWEHLDVHCTKSFYQLHLPTLHSLAYYLPLINHYAVDILNTQTVTNLFFSWLPGWASLTIKWPAQRYPNNKYMCIVKS